MENQEDQQDTIIQEEDTGSAFDRLLSALGDDAPPLSEDAKKIKEAIASTESPVIIKEAIEKPDDRNDQKSEDITKIKDNKGRTGRPKKFPDGEIYVATQVYLTESERSRLAGIGGGNNRSEGVRRLLRWHEAESLPNGIPVG